MNKSVVFIGRVLVLPIALIFFSIGVSRAEEVTIAHQLMLNPWKAAIGAGTFEKETGYTIKWSRFDSGSQVINAMASGDLQIAVAGSSPIAAGLSRGIDAQLFWVLEDIASAEELVVRNGSGINAPQDLRGKKLATPFVSTSHYQLLFALEQFGIKPDEVTVLNLQPQAIAAAWERGDIDGAFVWDPALSRIKATGKVLISSGQLCKWGKCTFDGVLVDRKWGEAHKDFMAKFVKIIADEDDNYRKDPSAWTPDSPMVKSVAKLTGGDPKDVPAAMAAYSFPTLQEEASDKWLGGGQDSGAARALRLTSEFLKDQKKIPAVQPDYSKFVTPEYVEMAMKLK